MLSQSSCNNKSSRVFSFLSVCQRDSSALLPSVERELSATNCAILCLTCVSREIVQRVSGKARDSSSEIVDKFGVQWIWWKKSQCNSRMLSLTMQFFETSTLRLQLILFGFCVTNAADIVFKYRQTVTRSFQHLQGDYYIAPAFMVSVFALSLSLSLSLSQSKDLLTVALEGWIWVIPQGMSYAVTMLCSEFKHVYLQLDMCHGSHKNLKPKPLVASECIKKVSGYGDEWNVGFAIMKVQ